MRQHICLLLREGDPMRRFLLLLLIPLSFTSLAAQDTLTVGDRVRVTTEEERRDDLPGQPLTWKVSTQNLLAQLLIREEVLR